MDIDVLQTLFIGLQESQDVAEMRDFLEHSLISLGKQHGNSSFLATLLFAATSLYANASVIQQELSIVRANSTTEIPTHAVATEPTELRHLPVLATCSDIQHCIIRPKEPGMADNQELDFGRKLARMLRSAAKSLEEGYLSSCPAPSFQDMAKCLNEGLFRNTDRHSLQSSAHGVEMPSSSAGTYALSLLLPVALLLSYMVEKAPVKKHTDCLSNEGGNTDPNEPRFMPSRTGEAAGEATQTLHAKHQQDITRIQEQYALALARINRKWDQAEETACNGGAWRHEDILVSSDQHTSPREPLPLGLQAAALANAITSSTASKRSEKVKLALASAAEAATHLRHIAEIRAREFSSLPFNTRQDIVPGPLLPSQCGVTSLNYALQERLILGHKERILKVELEYKDALENLVQSHLAQIERMRAELSEERQQTQALRAHVASLQGGVEMGDVIITSLCGALLINEPKLGASLSSSQSSLNTW